MRFAMALPVIALTINSAQAIPPDFFALPDLPGGAFDSMPWGISPDGTVVVGTGTDSAGTKPVIWSHGAVLAASNLQGYSTAADCLGEVVVGTYVSGSEQEAFRWTPNGTTNLGGLWNPIISIAYGVTPNGEQIVGTTASGTNSFDPFVWNEASGMRALGTLPGAPYPYGEAMAISGDGSTVIGYVKMDPSDLNSNESFRWSEATGMVSLGDIAEGLGNNSAYGVSSDGSVIVGLAYVSSGYRSFRWTAETGMVELACIPGGTCSNLANAVSGDGEVVVGLSFNGFPPSNRGAYVWDASRGMRSVYNDLKGRGVTAMIGWNLVNATAASADGQYIAGYGVNPSGATQAWLAVIPRTKSCPADLNGNGAIDLSDLAALLSVYGRTICDSAYRFVQDCNGDGIVDLSDLATVLADYGMVCP